MANRLIARSLIRHAAGVAARRLTIPRVAAWSSTRAFSSTAAEQLSDLLARELVEEQEANDTMPAALVELMDEIKKEWKIVEDDGTVKLFRNGGNVAINFHCQESLPSTDDVDDDDDVEASAPVRFTVAVTKAGKTLVMWCLSEMGVAGVEGLAVTTGDVASVFATGVPNSAYQGPEFTELEEDVQDAFNDYLQTDCGVTSDVAAFIAMYADYKEQAEYVDWMKQVQSIIS